MASIKVESLFSISFFRPQPKHAGEIWKRSFISVVRPTVHTNPSRKQYFSKTLFKPEEFKLKRRLRVWTRVDGKILKTELFENDDVTKITLFACSSFPQTQIQSDRWLLRS